MRGESGDGTASDDDDDSAPGPEFEIIPWTDAAAASLGRVLFVA